MIKATKRGVAKVVTKITIVIVALRECFMYISVNDLVQKLSGNPKIIEIEEEEKIMMMNKLAKIKGGENVPWELPAVYVGGKLLGGVDKVMEAHIKGEFVPTFRVARALWL
ncbi:MAG: hypothetical protein Q8887_02595 [Candidatus Phytoplasma australasiaticum]|nr:hypothetical protein [Candidatus Phytoplasma australasiaticum]